MKKDFATLDAARNLMREVKRTISGGFITIDEGYFVSQFKKTYRVTFDGQYVYKLNQVECDELGITKSFAIGNPLRNKL